MLLGAVEWLAQCGHHLGDFDLAPHQLLIAFQQHGHSPGMRGMQDGVSVYIKRIHPDNTAGRVGFQQCEEFFA